ncbi:MAG: hypothetical protein ARM1_0293 [Candidatus Micrarchaeota archaeon]|nr:MAG: hypothetical protein ARM1_0293 [Candidatus Micrarchaeota archaeon]
MSKVSIVYRIYPKENYNSERLKSKLMELGAKGVQEEEVAFGIKVVKALFVYEDSEGSTEIEDSIKKLEDVNELDVEEESLI